MGFVCVHNSNDQYHLKTTHHCWCVIIFSNFCVHKLHPLWPFPTGAAPIVQMSRMCYFWPSPDIPNYIPKQPNFVPHQKDMGVHISKHVTAHLEIDLIHLMKKKVESKSSGHFILPWDTLSSLRIKKRGLLACLQSYINKTLWPNCDEIRYNESTKECSINCKNTPRSSTSISKRPSCKLWCLNSALFQPWFRDEFDPVKKCSLIGLQLQQRMIRYV